MDSTCFIDMAKGDIANLHEPQQQDAWFCKRLLEAHRAGKVQVFTAILTVAECQHVDGICDDKIQRLFHSLLTSGQFVSLVQDTIIIADRARKLKWIHNVSLKGADSLHMASALEMGCSEFLSSDPHFLTRATELSKLGIRTIYPRQLPLTEVKGLQFQISAGRSLFRVRTAIGGLTKRQNMLPQQD